ncbi:AAA family ATPase [Malacoplasma iowae]|uniref:AAA family ATPase n=1 Tax=Malacoplasma iowae 695 TaxID=1048830 RepID=A0A6P1LMM1_MALIO|nr:AAA family ATPase [Malacoplasma iowae]QHG90193.1 AAA family ATPase [Malacoplasma iowae 695]WPL36058.1 AAA family ATPase [Malacoplasma iowae]VEU61665.1 ATPase family associated with various cellular activities (AAA) [Mycoplasmopsis fermentans]VEU71235.1 ATPase family associated with various cellular activities (AAA) [Malacoplasma iowae]
MFTNRKKIKDYVGELIDERILTVSRDIIEHVETGISSKELKATLESMNIREIELAGAKKQHFLFEKVLKLVAADFHVYLYSMPGAGKTYMAQEIAKSLNLDFYFSGAILEPYKLLGFKSAKGDYIETDFYKCFKNGGLFLFDEMDASNPEALIIINSALANKFLDFPNGRVTAHEKFRLIAAGNTNGLDIGAGFTARQQLDIATLDRFVFLEMPYDEKLEERFARGYVNGKHYFDRFIMARRIAQPEKLPIICSTRALILGLRLTQPLTTKSGIKSLNFSWKEAFEMTILKNALPKVKDRILSLIEEAEQKARSQRNASEQEATQQSTIQKSSTVASKTTRSSGTSSTSAKTTTSVAKKK